METGSKLSWWCGGGLFGFIIGFIFGLVIAVLAFVATELFSLGNMIANQSLMPYNTRNSNSCLCGGTEPTVLCDNPCRDLCFERNEKQSCTRCFWRCSGLLPDGTAKHEVYPYPNQEDWYKCCPTTRPDGCNQKPSTKCPTCFDCLYACDFDDTLDKWAVKLISDTKTNLPCCSGTPNPADKQFAEEECSRNSGFGWK